LLNLDINKIDLGGVVIFPKGEVVHKNLSTAYTNLSALISTLKLEGFSGTIELEFPVVKGILFIDSGEIINGEVRSEAPIKRITGGEAIQKLLELSKDKDGVLSIYRLLPEQVALVASNLRNEIVFKGLSASSTPLDRLLLKLKEGRFNGFIEFIGREDQPMGVLFFEGGEPIDLFTTPKTGPSVFGLISIQTFIENAIHQGATLNVYKRLE
jgi:hypothetical protein